MDPLYEVFPVSHNNDIFFCVFEVMTQQAIDFYYFKEDAEKCANFLATGGAFSGFTPAFILVEPKVRHKDPNDAFKQVLTK
jgi:hypothetical protein